MCAPSAAVPLAVGGLQAFGGMMSAQGQYDAQVAGVRGRNRAAMRQYQYQQQVEAFERQRAIERQRIAVQQYQRVTTNTYNALGQNYNALQRQFDNQYRLAFEAEQNEAIQLAQTLGKASTRGLSGRTAERVDTAAYQQRGRNQAMRQQNLIESEYAYRDQAGRVRQDAYNTVLNAYGSVANPLMFGPSRPAPVMESMPNRMGLYGGYVSAFTSGLGTVSSLSPGGSLTNLFRSPTQS